MNVTHEFEAELLTRGLQERICAMQNDANTRSVKLTLLSGGTAWPVPAGTKASVVFRNLKDGHKGWYDTLPNGTAACTVSGNVVTAVLAPAVLSGAGEVKAAIVLQDGNLNRLATFGFSILVEPDPAAGTAIANDYYKYSTMEAVSEAVDAMLESLEETKADIGQLISQVNTAVAQVQKEAGPAIVCEETGTAIAMQDSSGRQLQGLTLYGKTTQAGTPTPDAPVELESVGDSGSITVNITGKNLLKTPLTRRRTGFRFEEAFPVQSGAEYTLSFDITNASSWRITWSLFQADGTLLSDTDSATTSKVTPSTADGAFVQSYYVSNYGSYVFGANRAEKAFRFIFSQDCYVVFGVYYGDTTDTTAITNGQFEIGSAATAYEPYKGQTITAATPNGLPGIPVTSGGNYTDKNGQQWICDEVDFSRGVYVQRVLSAEVGAMDFTSVSGGNAYATVFPVASNYYTIGLCTHAKLKHSSSPGVGYCGISPNGVLIFGTDKTSLEDFRAWLGTAKIQVLAPTQATPIETALSAEELAAYAALHTNKPNTTAMNDASAWMRLQYVADTKTYIDNKFTELQSAIIAAGANA